ncbi:phosphoribosylglycinamide synthetase [Fusarium oxysporum Fo47]|uniref:phosphoribosylglycinamide synthetase n=1 Tax=Fusarium oxysporum Fo47 TaxID=660027 RepID=UPI002869AC51|nr:phosphoribosylglycinamide synthetase [Fusarium oxysporum Fo47]QKD59600.2 phosphoribosylglycinamide synthetase [Fusarium oxysporum Fo47]
MVSRTCNHLEGVTIILKCENLQFPEQLDRGLVTYNTGNHALALLMTTEQMSKVRGQTIPIQIYVPSSASNDKISAIKSYCTSPTTVVLQENGLDRCAKEAMEACKSMRMTFVPPANDSDIILGQAIAAVEFQDQVAADHLGELDAIVVPCGGGSLLSGCASWFRGVPTQVWGAEPQFDGPGLHASLKAGIILPKQKSMGMTIADGQRTTLSPTSWAILRDQTNLQDSVVVTEAQIRKSMSLYHGEFGGIIEPSSAVAMAACFEVPQRQVAIHNATTATEIGVILSEGNISAGTFHRLSRNINLAVFTNEADLAAGAVDLFSQEGIPCIGPPKKASLLETSKVFAKRFMSKNNIPTATYGHFSCYEESLLFIEDQFAQGRRKVVLKHPGIGARQGVFVIETLEEAKQTLPDFDILIEEFLEGREFTIMALTDGRNFTMFPPYLDVKTRKENNQGPMTGGMGCVCPTIRCTESMFQALAQGFMARIIAGLGKEGLDFPGFIAIDVILTHDGPIAIEYDLRLGDPETQALMPLIQPDLDLAKVLAQCHSDQISLSSSLFQKDRFAAVVVAVTKKYPLEPETQPLHVNLTTPTQKAQRAYSGMEAVKFEGMEYRTDIGCVLLALDLTQTAALADACERRPSQCPTHPVNVEGALELSRARSVKHVFVFPGNAGTHEVAASNGTAGISAFEGASSSEYHDLAKRAKDIGIGLVVVGPDDDVVNGIEESFRKVGVSCFAPSREAAELEGSKVSAKEFMNKFGIPTAHHGSFDNLEAASAYVRHVFTDKDHRIVIKADGLAAGKGVVLPETPEEALEDLRSIMSDGKFSTAGSSVVIEEYMDGYEISILTFSDGKTFFSLPPGQDHKRILEGNKGPNTGGMGVYSPVPMVTPDVLQKIDEVILKPTFDALAKEGRPFCGLLFTGVMVTKSGPKVIEYNVRFGDPETQSSMLLIHEDTDLASVMLSCTNGTLAQMKNSIRIKSGFACNVVIASGGYPGDYKTGKVATLSSPPEGVVIFHAGTRKEDRLLKTAGGRVFSVAAYGDTLEEARRKAYMGVGCVSFEDMVYRKDIALGGLAK